VRSDADRARVGVHAGIRLGDDMVRRATIFDRHGALPEVIAARSFW
jgi:hypothetical protein